MKHLSDLSSEQLSRRLSALESPNETLGIASQLRRDRCYQKLVDVIGLIALVEDSERSSTEPSIELKVVRGGEDDCTRTMPSDQGAYPEVHLESVGFTNRPALKITFLSMDETELF